MSKIEYKADTTLLVFGLTGRSQLGKTRDNFRTVKAGEIWIFNLRKDHFYRYSAAGVLQEMAVLKISTERLKAAFSDKDSDFQSIFNIEDRLIAVQQNNHDWIYPLLENPLNNPLDRIKAEARALELIAHWLIPVAHNLNGQDVDAVGKPLERARKILISSLSNPPTLEALAKEVGMSHTRLNRDFKKHYGKTVFSWLRSYRHDLAKSYLSNNTYSITEIAHMCGYSSASHFTQTFKLQEGKTPATFRQDEN